MSKKNKDSSKKKNSINKKVTKKVVTKKADILRKNLKKSGKPKVSKNVKKPTVNKNKKTVFAKVSNATKKLQQKKISKNSIKESKKLITKKVAKKTKVKKPLVAKKKLITKKTVGKIVSKKTSPKKVLKPIKKKLAKKIAKKIVTKKAKIKALKSAKLLKKVKKNRVKKIIKVKKIKPEKVAKVNSVPVKKPIIAPTTFRQSNHTHQKFVNEPNGKFEMEFVIRASDDMIFEFVSTESGLSEWFCDDVSIRDGIFTFDWAGGQAQQAILIKELPPIFIRYQWIDKNDGSYFEFKTQKDELTNDISLIITDFADSKAEEISARLLWQSQIDKLLHVLGSFS